MKVGIIVHSRTGFTYTVAKRLEEKFSVLRHDVQIERIIPVDEKQTDIKKIQFKSTPDLQVSYLPFLSSGKDTPFRTFHTQYTLNSHKSNLWRRRIQHSTYQEERVSLSPSRRGIKSEYLSPGFFSC